MARSFRFVPTYSQASGRHRTVRAPTGGLQIACAKQELRTSLVTTPSGTPFSQTGWPHQSW